MKRTILCIIILLGIILLFTNQVFAQDTTAQLITGKAFYKFTPQEQWKNLTSQSISLPIGSFVFTSDGSSAKVIFSDNSFVTLNENSLLKINNRVSTDTEENLYIKTIGKLILETKKIFGKKTEFKIETPTALATIRGTKVQIIVGNNLYSSIKVLDGDVVVNPSYLFRGMVAKNTRSFLLINTSEGTKTVNLSAQTIIADRAKDNSSALGETSPPPIEGTLNAPEVIKEGDTVVVYGNSVSADATLILFAGPDIGNNSLDPYSGYVFVNALPADTTKQPATIVKSAEETMIAPGVPCTPPVLSPFGLPTVLPRGLELSTVTPITHVDPPVTPIPPSATCILNITIH